MLAKIPDDFTEEDLRSAFLANGPLQRFSAVVEEFRNEQYPLRAVYVEYAQDGLNDKYGKRKEPMCHNDTTIDIACEYSTMSEFACLSLVVLGLDASKTKHEVMEHFQRFRAKAVQMCPSESGRTSSAVVTFRANSDRERAVVACETIPGTRTILYPSYNKVRTVIQADGAKESDVDGTMAFVWNATRYVCARKDVAALCLHVDVTQDVVEIDPSVIEGVSGDFGDVVEFIGNRKVMVDEMNVQFLSKIGSFLGIESLSRLNVQDYVTGHNIIYIASKSTEDDTLMILGQCIEHLVFLRSCGSLYLLPMPILCEAVNQLGDNQAIVRRFLIQTGCQSCDRTELLKRIKFDSLGAMELRTLLLDQHINLNPVKRQFMSAYTNVANAPPYICLPYRPQHAFEGIFHFLAQQSGGNPHTTGLVTLEASSTQAIAVHRILDYGPNDYFSTRDLPRQWIKFHFHCHRVSLNGYTYKTHSVHGSGHSRSWTLDGSDDGLTWRVIHQVEDTTELMNYGAVYHASFPATPFFTHFRITQTAVNSSNYNNFRVANIEFFGRIQNC